MQRLLWKGTEEIGDDLIRRAGLHRRHRGGFSAFEGHLLEAKESQVAAAAGDVAGDGLKHVGQQRGRQHRLVCLEWVLHRHGLTARIVLVQAPDVEGVVGNKRRRQHLGVAGVGQAMTDSAAALLRRSQAASAGRGRQHGRDILQPLQAQDLLNKVHVHGDIRAPRGRGNLQLITVVGDVTAHLAQALDNGLTGVLHAGVLAGLSGAQGDGIALGDVPHERPAGLDSAAGNLL